MAPLSLLDLEAVTGGGEAVSVSPEAGQYWHGRTRDHVSGDNARSVSPEVGSFWSRPRVREVDEDGVPYATGTSWHGR